MGLNESRLANALDVRSVGSLLAGIVAGYGVFTLLGRDVVVLPVVGSVSGQVLGIAGLVAFAVTYRRLGCGWGSSGNCGCSGECGDRCSHDP